MRSSEAMNAWRRDCSTTPLRASTSTSARSAVDPLPFVPFEVPCRRSDARATCSSWSSKIAFVSYSSRPMSVDLPSSTDPAVANRSSSLEVSLTLPILHGGLGHAVVGARLAALGDAGRGDLGDDVLERRGPGLDRAGDD